MLLVLTGPARLVLIRQMLQAHCYGVAFGIWSDLVLVCAGLGVDGPVAADNAKGVFVVYDGKLDDGDRILLHSVARLVIGDAAGTL